MAHTAHIFSSNNAISFIVLNRYSDKIILISVSLSFGREKTLHLHVDVFLYLQQFTCENKYVQVWFTNRVFPYLWKDSGPFVVLTVPGCDTAASKVHPTLQ